MRLYRDFESVIKFVNSIDDGKQGIFYTSVDVFSELIDRAAYLFDVDVIKAYKCDKVGFVGRKMSAYVPYYEEFEAEGCGKCNIVVGLLATTEGGLHLFVNGAFHVLEIEGRFYSIYKTSSKRFGLSLFGATKTVRQVGCAEQPHYFSLPSKKAVNRWVEWLADCEVKNAAEVEKVKELHRQVREQVEQSGLRYEEVSSGLRVYTEQIVITIAFNEAGVAYDYGVNYSALGRGGDAFKSIIGLCGNKPTQRDEEPRGKSKQSAYSVFKALAIEEVDGSQRWTAEAVKILEVAAADSSAVVSDICNRALKGVVKLSDKQRWCVAYAYTRVV